MRNKRKKRLGNPTNINRTSLPTLLAAPILYCLPQWGQLTAFLLISFPHSLQLISDMGFPYMKVGYYNWITWKLFSKFSMTKEEFQKPNANNPINKTAPMRATFLNFFM